MIGIGREESEAIDRRIASECDAVCPRERGSNRGQGQGQGHTDGKRESRHTCPSHQLQHIAVP